MTTHCGRENMTFFLSGHDLTMPFTQKGNGKYRGKRVWLNALNPRSQEERGFIKELCEPEEGQTDCRRKLKNSLSNSRLRHSAPYYDQLDGTS
jgi:hypothetical protein